MNWMLDHVPLVVILGVAAAAGVVLFRLGGWKAVLSFGVLIVATLLYRDGRKTGRDDSQAEGRRDADRTVRRAEEARIDAQRRDADPDRLRDDDGFRRD